MQIGDIVAVIDPRSSHCGMWGLFSHTTRTGQVVVNLMDGSVEAMDPFQVEDYEGLVAARVTVRQAAPVREIRRGQRMVRTETSPTNVRCLCGHPKHKHREYHGYVACTGVDVTHRQCRCRSVGPPSTALQSVLAKPLECGAE